MTPIDRLIAIDGIRRCKAGYWYYLDTKQWDRLGEVFARDAITDFRGERDLKPGEDYDRLPPVEQALAAGDVTVARGRAAIIRFMKEVIPDWITVHHGHEPLIDIIDENTASAVWPMFDYIDNGRSALKGYGHYHDIFRFEDGAWRIAMLRVTRLRVDGNHPASYSTP